MPYYEAGDNSKTFFKNALSVTTKYLMSYNMALKLYLLPIYLLTNYLNSKQMIEVITHREVKLVVAKMNVLFNCF